MPRWHSTKAGNGLLSNYPTGSSRHSGIRRLQYICLWKNKRNWWMKRFFCPVLRHNHNRLPPVLSDNKSGRDESQRHRPYPIGIPNLRSASFFCPPYWFQIRQRNSRHDPSLTSASSPPLLWSKYVVNPLHWYCRIRLRAGCYTDWR